MRGSGGRSRRLNGIQISFRVVEFGLLYNQSVSIFAQVAPPASPPVWESWLFESPLFLMGLLVGVALVLLVMNRGRADRRFAIAAGVCLLLAVGNYFLAGAVTTPRETILERTRALVRATAPLGVAELSGFFTPDAELIGPNGETWADMQTLIATVALVDERFPITEQQLFAVAAEADREAGTGVSLFDVKTRARSANVPALTRWRAEWVWSGGGNRNGGAAESDGGEADEGEVGGGWTIRRVQWLEHESPNGIQPNIGRLR